MLTSTGKVEHKLQVILVATAVSLLCAAAPAPHKSPTAVDSSYRQSFEQWKAGLVEDRKQEWLPLAGLFWLKAGNNTFGTDPKNSIVFPKGPAQAGSFALDGTTVSVRFTPSTNAIIDGKPVTATELKPDTSGKPTIVEIGSLRFHVIARGERIGIRLKDLESNAVRQFRGTQFFPLDLSYRVVATWVPSDGKKTVDVPNVLGDVRPVPIGGTAVFKINGQELRLTELGGEGGKLFFVFSDPTSKTSTYPGGRFLKAEPTTGGTVVLDFNRAYNPPCAITPYATCPLAPKENRLTVAISAGEEYDHKNGHH